MNFFQYKRKKFLKFVQMFNHPVYSTNLINNKHTYKIEKVEKLRVKKSSTSHNPIIIKLWQFARRHLSASIKVFPLLISLSLLFSKITKAIFYNCSWITFAYVCRFISPQAFAVLIPLTKWQNALHEERHPVQNIPKLKV